MELIDFLPLSMFLVLGAVLFTGYPVIFVLGGLSLAFGLLGHALGLFQPVEFYNIVPRIWGGVAENLVLTAVPTFVFMGSMLERSGIANDLLFCLQVIMRRVPGGLALSVTVMGTIMAAMTGIIGASVVMMTMLALPAMMQHRYNPQLATGTIAASGTLGILIPPSILLVIMADLLSVSVGNLFVAALIPGLFLAALYFGYILTISSMKPEMAPPLEEKQGPETLLGVAIMLARGFIPPVVLILLIKIAIFDGWATPTEAGGVGAAGAWLLALVNGRCSWRVLSEVCQRTGLTVAMIFGIFMGATAFSYVFRSLGGDDIVVELVEYAGFGSWGLLMLVMGICFLLGFFLDWVEITLIVLPIFTPILSLLDFGDHVPKAEIIYWFAILVAVNLQTSFLTPPFGFALFYMKGVAPPEINLRQIYTGIVPFVILQLIGLGTVIMFPDVSLWLMRQWLT